MRLGDRLEQVYYAVTGRPRPDVVRRILERPGWLPAGGAVLDFGGGDGRLAVRLAEARDCTLTVADIRAEALARVPPHPRLSAVRLDGPALPFPDASFDLVLAHHVLHHVRDLPGVLAELRRILRPGGVLVAAEIDPAGLLARGFRLLAWLRRDPVHFTAAPALAARLAAAPLDVGVEAVDPSHYLVVGRRPA